MIKLRNGVVLDKVLREEFGFQITKAEAKKVFGAAGRLGKVTVTCTKCTEPHTDTFAVIRMSGKVTIGCCVFSPDMVAKVREWANGRKRRSTSKKSA